MRNRQGKRQVPLNNEGVRYMEQLLIVEDDIGLNQGLEQLRDAQ